MGSIYSTYARKTLMVEKSINNFLDFQSRWPFYQVWQHFRTNDQRCTVDNGMNSSFTYTEGICDFYQCLSDEAYLMNINSCFSTGTFIIPPLFPTINLGDKSITTWSNVDLVILKRCLKSSRVYNERTFST